MRMKMLPWFTIERRRRSMEVIKSNDYREDTKKANEEHFFPVS